MGYRKVKHLAVVAMLALGACESTSKTDTVSSRQVIKAWEHANLGDVALDASKESKLFPGGTCRSGRVAALRVDLCEFSDAVSADAAKDKGLIHIGSNTGAALVRDRYLLVVADVESVDAHGKTLNRVAKIFLSPLGGGSPSDSVPVFGK